jgi:hypothetical protein
VKARLNPFTADRILARVRYRPDGFTWHQLLARLEHLNYRAAIVGPHGTGKTTLLEDLAPHLESRGFHCRTITLRSDDRRLDARRLRGLRPSDLLLLDGAEQLGPLAWQRVRFASRRARAGGLIVTSHVPGRLPTLLETRVSPATLRAILSDLLGGEAGDAPTDVDCATLLARHHGNAREVLRFLYDRAASAGGGGARVGADRVMELWGH